MKSQLKKLFFLLSPAQKVQLAILFVLMLVGMGFEIIGLGVLVPALGIMLNSDITNEYPALKPFMDYLGNPTHLQLVSYGMAFLVFVYLIKAIFLIFLSWRQSKFSAELSADIRQKLFEGYVRQPYTFHLHRNSAELLRNIQIEMDLFTAGSQAAISLTLEFCVVFGVAFMLIWVEPVGALSITLFLAVSALGFYQVFKNKLVRWGEHRQFYQGLSNQHLLQGLGGVKDVKLMGKEDFFVGEYTTQNQKYTKILVKVTTLGFIPRLYLELLAVIGLTGLIISMMLQNKPLDLLIPTLGVFVAAAFRMIPSVNRMLNATQTTRYIRPVLDILYNEFQLFHNLENPAPHHSGKLKFFNDLSLHDIGFSYVDTQSKAINNINISIKKGECIGFIGPSGSGKSTLVDVILGLLTPDHGTIAVDGQNIKNNIRSWQDQIGYVPQTIYLTDDTLRHNIAFGIVDSEVDNSAVDRAVKAAQLDEFLYDLPLGLETMVGERGVRLSGGQRQRIGIARALYHDPAVLILDEATSALDSNTERGVMKAVSALKGDKTLLIIAHRLSTLEHCNRIYRLEKGEIVSEGIPEKMLSEQKMS